MRLLRRTFRLIAIFALTLPSLAQDTDKAFREQATALYQDAKPYIDLPIKDLRRDVQELDGLKPDESKDAKPMLRSTMHIMDQLVSRMPNLIANEHIESRMSPFFGDNSKSADFEYVLRVATPANGVAKPNESRNAVGKKQGDFPIKASGFGGLWTLFLPTVIDQQRYRYIGTQKIAGHQTNVIVFAQIPSEVLLPGTININYQEVPLLQQGIVWIDQETSQIAQILTDILKPQPSLRINKITTVVAFKEIKLPGLSERLPWLPTSITVRWAMNGRFGNEKHLYTNYRLYKATVRVLP